MASAERDVRGPRGGIQVSPRMLRAWRWSPRGPGTSSPVRCRQEQWYLARARAADGVRPQPAVLLVAFLRNGDRLEERCLRLWPLADGPRRGELLGWTRTPPGTTYLQLSLPDAGLAGRLAQVVLHDVAERDPKCHPLASVPRWRSYEPPFPVERVVLPAGLRGLVGVLAGVDVRILREPVSRARLARAAGGAACVLDPRWVRDLRLAPADIERLAAASWLVVDLETAAGLFRAAGATDVRLRAWRSAHGLMAARVTGADVATRGLALEDVVPYATVDAGGAFRMRALRAGRAGRRRAAGSGWTALLAGETPWDGHPGDMLSTARRSGRGALLVTDLPWLVAGWHGPLLAPRIAAHLLRMHLARPLDDDLQYWNRSDDTSVLVRDISDLARRFAPLRPVRWASGDPGLAHLGLSLPPPGPPPGRHLLVRTGRIDAAGVHDGLPPEPLMIFMKALAREAREQTPWARRHLARQIVTWQFDTRAGLKYAANYDSAAALAGPEPTVLELRLGAEAPAGSDAAAARAGSAAAGRSVLRLPDDEGLLGDGGLDLLADLSARLRAAIERGVATADAAGAAAGVRGAPARIASGAG